MKLNKSEIDLLSCPPGRRDVLVFDDELTGFAIRVTSGGQKLFLFQYRRGTSVHRIRLGKYGDVTPAQARKTAEALRGQVAAGGDPAADRRAAIHARDAEAAEKRKQQLAAAFTFAMLVDRWEEDHLTRHRSERHAVEAVRALRYSLADLAEPPAAGIDAATARKALAAVTRPAKNPADNNPRPAIRGATMARRVRSYARAMYAWALKRGLVPANPFADIPVEGRDVQRDRFLTDAELGDVWRAAGALGWPWGPYLRFLLLTLQREAETAGLRRAELAPDLSTWELPGSRTKNGRPHVVHLSAPARAILREAPAIEGSPLIFTTTGTSPLQGFAKAKLRIDAQIIADRAKTAAAAGTEPAPLVPWRFHDFRRTGPTAMARLGVRWEVADRLLNHVQGAIRGVAAIYQRYDFLEERAAALDLWAAHVLAVGEAARPAGNVIEFRPGGKRRP